MSDAETEGEAAEEVESETVEGEESDPEDQPDIEDEEKADIDIADIDPDEIENEAGASDTEENEDDESESDENADSTAADSGSTTSREGKTWGDMYVKGLSTVTEAAKDELGEGGDVDESLALQLDLDEHFDEWLDSQGMGEDMPPGQAVMVGTCMFLMVELGTDSEIVSKAMNGGF